MSGLERLSVFEAGHGLEALEGLSEEWLDVVFSDLNMPEMNGMELVEKMSDDSTLAKTPVVIVSSDRSRKRQEELAKRGVRAFITKPFRSEDFRDAVETVLSVRLSEASFNMSGTSF
ncbi:MAG: response regulator [Proteobacteria bacterium]|nr:response regulator [Pseudomonadota bacterium]